MASSGSVARSRRRHIGTFRASRGVMKRTLWALALAVFFTSVVGVKVVAQPAQVKTAPTPFTTFQGVTVYSL
jgi:hypothetical protein